VSDLPSMSHEQLTGSCSSTHLLNPLH